MARTQRVSSTLNGEGAARNRATPSSALLGGIELPQGTERQPGVQESARGAEGIARRHALAALLLGGGLALQEAALSRHYARRAVALMREGRQ
jgi:hypothetical protein